MYLTLALQLVLYTFATKSTKQQNHNKYCHNTKTQWELYVKMLCLASFCDAESWSEMWYFSPGSFFLFPSQRTLPSHRCKGHLSCSAEIYSIQIKLRSHVAPPPSHLSPQRSCKGLIYKPNNKLPFSIPYKAHGG